MTEFDEKDVFKAGYELGRIDQMNFDFPDCGPPGPEKPDAERAYTDWRKVQDLIGGGS